MALNRVRITVTDSSAYGGDCDLKIRRGREEGRKCSRKRSDGTATGSIIGTSPGIDGSVGVLDVASVLIASAGWSGAACIRECAVGRVSTCVVGTRHIDVAAGDQIEL